jgi:hypothetical protein
MMPCCEGTNPKPGVIVCQKKNYTITILSTTVGKCSYSHVPSFHMYRVTNAYSQSPRTLALTKLTLKGEEEDGGQ